MLEFVKYFFGKGESEEFTNFTFAHFAPIILAIGVIFLIYCFRENIANLKNEKSFRYVIAFILIISEMSYFWRLVAMPSLGANPVDHLPITPELSIATARIPTLYLLLPMNVPVNGVFSFFASSNVAV